MIQIVPFQGLPFIEIDYPQDRQKARDEIVLRLGSQVDVSALYAQWWEGIQMLTPEQQKRIKEYVNELEKQRVSFTGLRRLAVRLGLDPIYHSILGAMRQIPHRLAGKPVYANVLVAAMQTDHILSTDREIQGRPH